MNRRRLCWWLLSLILVPAVFADEARPASPLKMPPRVPRKASDVSVRLDPVLARQQWSELLALGRRKGGDDERQVVAGYVGRAEAPWVRELARAFLDEWRYVSEHSLLRRPRRVWAAPIPELRGSSSGKKVRLVQGLSEVTREGKVVSVRIVDSSGDDEIDFQVQKWAREAWYRPAMKGTSWTDSRHSWAVEVK